MAMRTSVLLLLTVSFSIALLGGDGASEAREWEDPKLNCWLEVPDTWTWIKDKPDWAKTGIVRAARRSLKELKGGKPADGEGALLYLAIRDAPAETSLKDISRSDEVKEFLTGRFDGSPKIKFDDTGLTLKDDLPAVVLEAEGTAINLNAKKRPCHGILVVTVAKGKLYLLRLFAFPTEFDEEGVKVDIDYTAYSGFDILNPKEDVKHKPDPSAAGNAPDEPDIERVEEELDFEDIKLRMVKHAKLTRVDPLPSEGEDVVVKFEGSDQYGSYTVRVIAIPLNRIINGQQATPPAIKPAVTTDWWNQFINEHPKGAIYSYKWPKKTRHKTLLTFPEIENEKNKITVVKEDGKRPIDPKSSDIMKKMKFAQKVKSNKVGPKVKVSEAYRGVLHGNYPGQGQHYVAKFGFRTAFHTYRVYVGIWKEGYKNWGEAIRSTLESMEFYK